MERSEFKRMLFSRVEELPTLPAVLPKVLKLVEQEDATLTELADVIRRDQALTSKLLKAANSAYYGFAGEISSLRHAVSLLGFRMVKSLVLSIGVLKTLPTDGSFNHFSQQGLWEHSLAVATAMQMIGDHLHIGREDLFTIGLLHDIGIVIQAHFFTEHFGRMLELMKKQGIDQLEAEKEIFCCDHGEIGSMVLQRWHFPKEIIDPIAFHHKKTFPEHVDRKTLAMLRVANALPTEMNIGKTGLNYSVNIHPQDMAELTVSEGDVEQLKRQMQAAEAEILSITGIISPEK